ncbi:hypothetical protein Hdeb2414_s0032g00715621 [Helianthus debilis subsp. tardiflorus]
MAAGGPLRRATPHPLPFDELQQRHVAPPPQTTVSEVGFLGGSVSGDPVAEEREREQAAAVGFDGEPGSDIDDHKRLKMTLVSSVTYFLSGNPPSLLPFIFMLMIPFILFSGKPLITMSTFFEFLTI